MNRTMQAVTQSSMTSLCISMLIQLILDASRAMTLCWNGIDCSVEYMVVVEDPITFTRQIQIKVFTKIKVVQEKAL